MSDEQQLQELQHCGWRIRATFLKELCEEKALTTTALHEKLLSADLRQAGIGCLSEEVAKGRDFAIRENFVLQLVFARNIAQPEQRDGDEASAKKKTMLFALTDGRMLIRCIDARGVTSLPSQIPPGTKILLKRGTVRKGIVLLEAGSLEVLGGRVDALAEEWEFQQKYGKLRPKADEEDEAPCFEHFDPAKPKTHVELGSFSTFDVLNKSLEGTTNSERSPSSSQRISVSSQGTRIFQNSDLVKAKLLAEMPEPPSSSHATSGRGRGRRRGRMREATQSQSTHTLTLEEYEARQQPLNSVDRDAALAKELDQQLNTSADCAEKDLMASMFSYAPKNEPPSTYARRGGRGRSRGRRGRGRGRR